MAKQRTRNQYSDDFRAGAILLLEGQGYPERHGALAAVSRDLHVPVSTLRGWWNRTRNPEPAQVRNLKKQDLKEIIRAEIHAALGEGLEYTRDEATYKERVTSAAILIDKLQLLEGEPTARIAHEDWRTAAIEFIRDGEIGFGACVDEYGSDLARQLFREAGIPIEPTPVIAGEGEE
jgi:transposase-like protein